MKYSTTSIIFVQAITRATSVLKGPRSRYAAPTVTPVRTMSARKMLT